jgi:protein involved in sex pheromone biosynthesis
MKNLIMMFFMVSLLCVSACGPKIKSQEDQEIKQSDSDSLNNPREGAGEGTVPDEVIK